MRLAPYRGLFLLVSFSLILMTESFKVYPQFNALTVTGRIAHAEVPKGQDFVAVTLITTLEKGGDSCTVTFNDNGRIKDNLEYLPVGRTITVTGHINSVSETYMKDGKPTLRSRPQMHLVQTQILTGGYGPMPRDKAPNSFPAGTVVQAPAERAVELDAAPSF